MNFLQVQIPLVIYVSPGQVSTHVAPRAYFEFKQPVQVKELLQVVHSSFKVKHAIQLETIE